MAGCPIYREPLVLCYLEGLTRDEAAARLRVPPATLKSQLDRGRKRLGAVLTRRGVVLGAGLLACAATSRAASSPRPAEAIRVAVAGNVAPPVAALAKGIAENGVLKKLMLGAVAVAAATALGFGIAEPRTTTAGQQPEKEMPAKALAKTDAPAAKPLAEKTIAVSGKVIDPDSKPARAKFAVIDDETGTIVPKGCHRHRRPVA